MVLSAFCQVMWQLLVFLVVSVSGCLLFVCVLFFVRGVGVIRGVVGVRQIRSSVVVCVLRRMLSGVRGDRSICVLLGRVILCWGGVRCGSGHAGISYPSCCVVCLSRFAD